MKKSLNLLKFLEGSILNENLPQFIEFSQLLIAEFSVADTTRLWIYILERDSSDNKLDEFTRLFLLISLHHSFEKHKVQAFEELKQCVSNTVTKTGKPLTMMGTRCEINIRLSEALFKTGRRTPGDSSLMDMLLASVDLTNYSCRCCNQLQLPEYRRRILGMRGLAKQMMGNHLPNIDEKERLTLLHEARADIIEARRLGNSGKESATYLLACEFCIYELVPTQSFLDEVMRSIHSLGDMEKSCRPVQYFLSKAHFSYSFFEPNKVEWLTTSLSLINQGLLYPEYLNYDDAFLRLSRGQILVRKYVLSQTDDIDRSLNDLSEGITDIAFAVEQFPNKYGKQSSLISALLSRAGHYQKTSVNNFAGAKADLEYIVKNIAFFKESDANLVNQAYTELDLLNLRELDVEKRRPEVKEALYKILTEPERFKTSFITVGHVIKTLFTKTNERDTEIIRRALKNWGSFDLDYFIKDTSKGTYESLFANLLLIFFKLQHDADTYYLEEAYKRLNSAVKFFGKNVHSAIFLLKGECCLQLAKEYLKAGSQTENEINLLEEAIDCFETGRSSLQIEDDEFFEHSVNYSKIGEAYSRLTALKRSKKYCHNAIENLEKSLAEGNNTSQLFGLLADSYYRAYIYKFGGKEDLDNAIMYKDCARKAGGVNRENYSLSSRLEYFSWLISHNDAQLEKAIEFIVLAHESDMNWPWPPFQMFELRSAVSPGTFDQLIQRIASHSSANQLVLAAVENKLIEFGAKLVSNDKEFKKKRFAEGRSFVYVLDDSHGLFENNYIFKVTQYDNAKRDLDNITKFKGYLKVKFKSEIDLPEPLAMISTDNANVVYVQRRAKGYSFGRYLLTAVEGADNKIAKAAEYLAYYHACTGLNYQTNYSIVDFLKSSFADLGIGIDSCINEMQSLNKYRGFYLTKKKDAHPENWLIDTHGKLVMIDFEGKQTIPLLYDLVQLVEDYPVFPATDQGTIQRLKIIDVYLTAIADQTGLVKRDEWELIYMIFWILRSAITLSRMKKGNEKTSSAVRNSDTRKRACRNSLTFLKDQNKFRLVSMLANAALLAS